ncbi:MULTISPECIES: ThuA domain-containing protein [Sphingobium]|uniref:ThuA domain-containing protein n=1 Tax=Sphingobium TaxID=165695 RepID=UPI000AD517E8|nr:ThuA domain-containing protein [Sphingobium sp. RSMS]UXC93417.1 ThuA domain-containing protein [Sphingobium sp. RSMS]
MKGTFTSWARKVRNMAAPPGRKRSHSRTPRPVGAALAAMAVAFLLPMPAGTAPLPPVRILLFAGPKQHGAPGRHEYEKDLRELAWLLEHSGAAREVKTQVIVGEKPRDLAMLEAADAIVIDGNGDWLKRETGAIFQQYAETDGLGYNAETSAALKGFDALLKRRKTGLVVYHYTMFVDNRAGRLYLNDWLGGVWIPYVSHNPVDTWAIRPIPGKHPILRGVKPWTPREEMYARYFLPDNPRRTPLLTARPSQAANGTGGPVAWAYERPDGGRSVVWGGNDFHDNMHLYPQQRRFLVNGILWAAGVEVPRGGANDQMPPEF